MEEPDTPLFSSSIGNTIVTIEVGTEKVAFTAHKDLLVACSPYFEAAFNGSFREANEKSIQIDAKPKIFQVFLDWLYFRRLPTWEIIEWDGQNCEQCGIVCERWPKPATPPIYQYEFPHLSEADDAYLEDHIEKASYRGHMLYVFADQFDVPALRRTLIDKEWKDFENDDRIWRWSSVIYALRKLKISSPLCRLLVDEFADRWGEFNSCETERALRTKLPSEFLYAVMAKQSETLADESANPVQRLGALCTYHEHPQDNDAVQACIARLKVSCEQKREELDRDEKFSKAVEEAEAGASEGTDRD
ncbi:hypothetical protein E6O75_ATG01677 [Venturia nashicola]|uniref:BTB domain-containing protein n=1 Tax=Venturia nashicola TaxID=86259 RepID=A0A4Z1NGM9_9PEZI|nr:hypothetical protein E6O75_ATG01677 [Venturia nashicola]